MGQLRKLNISNRVIAAARPRRNVDTAEYRRKKLIANIEEQIELVQLALKERPLVLKRKRGKREITVRPRIWWKSLPEGGIFTQIRYNKIPLNIDSRGAAIEAGTLENLLSVYGIVIKATIAGELDQAIEFAATKSQP